MMLFILNLAGAVALLLWSVRMIRTGIERAFAAPLRRLMRRAARSRISAAAAGAVAAIMLQSSTAVAMLAAGFAETGTLAIVAGIALILGADLGSAIAAQILLLPISALIPAMLVLGVALFLRGGGHRSRQAGRILVGIALVLVSLSMIRDAALPLRESDLVDAIVQRLANDPLSGFVLAAVMTYAMHSSIAAVLMFVTFALHGLLPIEAAATMVMGANFGGAMIPVALTWYGDRRARQIMLSNMLLRGGGAVIVVALTQIWPDLLYRLGSDAARQTINLHLAFNFAVLVVGLPFLSLAARLSDLILRPDHSDDMQRPTALDEDVLSKPTQAIANAQREVLRMAEETLHMLQPVIGLFRVWDSATADRIAEREAHVDRMHYEIKLYLSRLNDTELTAEQLGRTMSIATTANHLEDAGDQIAVNLLPLARKMHQQGLSFSPEGMEELTDFHDQVLSNTKLALNVMMTADTEEARQLIEEKDRMRAAEREMQNAHLARLRGNNRAAMETTNQHQEAIRALKQINTDFTFVAYPIVERAGDLRESRLA